MAPGLGPRQLGRCRGHLSGWEKAGEMEVRHCVLNVENLRCPPDITAQVGIRLDFLRGGLGQKHGTRIL